MAVAPWGAVRKGMEDGAFGLSSGTFHAPGSYSEPGEIVEQAGIPGVITHIKALGPPGMGYGGAIVRRIEMAREEGVEVYSDQCPYPASATGLGATLLPRWAQAGGSGLAHGPVRSSRDHGQDS